MFRFIRRRLFSPAATLIVLFVIIYNMHFIKETDEPKLQSRGFLEDELKTASPEDQGRFEKQTSSSSALTIPPPFPKRPVPMLFFLMLINLETHVVSPTGYNYPRRRYSGKRKRLGSILLQMTSGPTRTSLISRSCVVEALFSFPVPRH